MKVKFILFIVGIILSLNLLSQDTIDRKNIFSLALPSLLDKTLSLSYYSQLDSNTYFIFNPRYRAGFIEPLLYWGYLLGDDNHFLQSRALVRIGFQIQKKKFFYEPLLQIDYGWSKDQWSYDEDYERSYLKDFNYTSLGIILLSGVQSEKNKNIWKIYYGIGVHRKNIKITTKNFYDTSLPDPPDYFFQQKISRENKGVISLHFGLEYGRIF